MDLASALIESQARERALMVELEAAKIARVELEGRESKALAEKETRDKMFQNGIQPVGSSPEEFARFIALDLTRSAKIIRESGIQPE
jgi:tripartite-type tricarboxylate transporter receptor subunit TctC